MALCPHRGTILIERCKACYASLRVAPFATAASFSATTCTRCGESLLGGCYSAAHTSVARMQAALFRGKCECITELDGLALADLEGDGRSRRWPHRHGVDRF